MKYIHFSILAIKQLKFDQNIEAFEALKDGREDALAYNKTLRPAYGDTVDKKDIIIE